MRNMFSILLIPFLVCCNHQSKDMDLIGEWYLVTQTGILDGVEVSIPVALSEKGLNCKSQLTFLTKSNLKVSECISEYGGSASNPELNWIQKESNFKYEIEDSTIIFNDRKFKILESNEDQIILTEIVQNQKVTYQYRRSPLL